MPIRRKLFNKRYCIYGHGRNKNQHIKLRRYDRKQLRNKVLQSHKVFLFVVVDIRRSYEVTT